MRKQTGFTLIELLVVVAIIAILAAVAITQHQKYISQTRASAAIAELSGYRFSIAECITLRSSVTGCSAGSEGIPPLAAVRTTRNVTALTSLIDGAIIATSGATESSGGTPLGVVDTSDLNTPDKAIIAWTNTGTICNTQRGLKPGQGHCP